jgi:hypothetical protein
MISHSFAALTREISCSTLEINLVFPRTHACIILYIIVNFNIRQLLGLNCSNQTLIDKFSLIVVKNITNFILTEHEVCTEKYRTEVFFVQTKPVGRGLYKKTEFQYFSVHIYRAREVNKKFIIWQLLVFILETNKKRMI